MITINLLPHRSSPMCRESAGVSRPLALGIVAVLLSGTVCWGWGSSLFKQRDLVRHEKNSKEQMLASISANKSNDETLLDMQSRHDRLMAPAKFLAKYREDHYLPIRILDDISQSLEPLDLWLLALSIESDDVLIEGNALSHKDVGRFIQNLEESSSLKRLIKMETQPYIVDNDNVMQKFSLQFTTQISKR